MGHSVVDQLIIDIGKRLRSRLRHDDTVSRSTAIGGRPLGNETLARMDGNQFTVLLEDLKGPADSMRVAMRIQESLAARFTARDVDVFAFASIGIALSSPSYHSRRRCFATRTSPCVAPMRKAHPAAKFSTRRCMPSSSSA